MVPATLASKFQLTDVYRRFSVVADNRVMWMMANSSTNFFPVSSIFHDHLTDSPKNSNSIIFLKPISTTSILLLKPGYSCAKIRASTSLTRPTTTSREVIDYNAKINRFCEMGNLKNAMELLCGIQKSDLELETYSSVLELCVQHKSLEDGKRVHSVICSNGAAVDGFLGAKLVFTYLTCGDLKEGRRVFDKITIDKVFLWNFMINEYTKIRNFRESLSLFKKMQEKGVQADSYTFTSVLKCFAAIESLEGGQMIHGYLYKLGFSSYSTVMNSLIAFYFKSRRVESAQKAFDEMTVRDIISWNSMISTYAYNGDCEKGVEIFKEMLCRGIDMDLTTFVNVLVACAGIGAPLLGRTFHACAIKACLGKNIMFYNTLLDMYSKCCDMNSAIQVFEKMPERSIVSWTSMITGYIREGLPGKAFKLFYKMKENGISPDIYTVTSILHACACSCSLNCGKDVHNYIKENNMESNLFVSNALMDMYAKCGSMEDAYSVFSHMPLKDIISWNTIIGGYSKTCLPNEALTLFSKMQQRLKPDSTTMACILPACASLLALGWGQEIHAYILRHGYFSDRYVSNALVDMYGKCGALILARLVFDMIPMKDLISWTVLIAGYGMHGFGREAIAVFNDMRNAEIKPDEASFVAILYACSHSGLLDDGWKFFNIMRNKCNIEPKLEHYACMVDLLSRTGNLTEAYRFIKAMPIQPDASMWGGLLCGCRIYHDVKLAEKVAEHVFALEPENTKYYMLLAIIYDEAEKWEEIKKLRERIDMKGLKNRECSWIVIKGKVNIFVAGDNGSHPQTKRIESLLERLQSKMKEEGSSPKMQYALVHANDLEKEVVMCGHSEKRAMAFGILSLLPRQTIRVTKNMRVCGDCHEMGKFLSKTFGREIVLRDFSRFHHFKDGTCSCRGFW